MQNESNTQTLIPSPVGSRPESLGGIEVVIHAPQDNSYASAVSTTSADDSRRSAVPSQPPVPSDPLRSATDNLNVHSPQPKTQTGGKTSKTSGQKTGKTNSRYSGVKCNHCGKIGHIKKHCKHFQKQSSGGTRSSKKEALINEQLQKEAEQAAGAQDAQREMEQDPPASDVEECVQSSSEEPSAKLPAHWSSLSSPLENEAEETCLLEAILNRTRTKIPDRPNDAFMFWIPRLSIIIIAFQTLLAIAFGLRPMLFSLGFFLHLYYHLGKQVWRSCLEKKVFYETYIAILDSKNGSIHVEHPVWSDFDNGIQTSTELRTEQHSLKEAEIKPSLYSIKIVAPVGNWWLSWIFPWLIRPSVTSMVISYSLLKKIVCDVDYFNDSDQLLLRGQMQTSREQKVAISADDLSRYGDIYGNSAFIASLHNEAVNSHKRAVRDFLRSPASK